MNFIDLIIFLSILFFAWVGSRIGIVTTISSVLSGIFGSVAANLFYAKFAVFLPPKPSSLLVSYFIIFFSVSVLIFYTGHAISKLMHLMFFGLMDRFLGALTGILLGAVICGVLLMVAVVIPSENRDVAERQAFWQKWLGQDVRVIAVNPDLMHRPGPRLLDGMEDLYQQLSQGQTFEH